jgi:bacterioferritin-associated ferredoxin
MYVCVCRAVTDRHVNQVIEGGARSVEAVTRACGAGGDCGACRGMIGDMIETHEELVSAAKLTRTRAA